MDEFTLFCYSQENRDLIPLMETLKKWYKNEANRNFTHDKDSFLYSIENFVNPSTELIVLNLKDVDHNTVRLINTVNQLAPSTVKLLIAETKNLLSLQSQISQKESLHFLRDSWNEYELELAVKAAKVQNSVLKKTLLENEANLLIKKVEEEVAVRFHELIDSNVAKDKFLSVIAHDLKSPFLGLLGLTDILLNEWNDLEESEKIKLISDTRETSKETLKFLEDLLGWTKNQKEKLEVSINEIKIHNLVNTSIQINQYCAIPKGIKVHNKINDNLKVNADEHMVATVFRNLISNAVKFTQPGGNVKITAKENKNYFTFCVADNGIGIDKPDILKLFKTSKSHTNHNGNGHSCNNGNGKTRGHGLGLLLCKDFVERSGGKIWLETQKGVGSKFFFTLPAY